MNLANRNSPAYPSAFPSSLMLSLDVASALYGGMEKKSPGLLLRNKKDTPSYSENISDILKKIKAFKPTAYSISADSLDAVVALIAELGVKRVLEFGSGVTTFALPTTIGARLEKYVSIEESSEYADVIRTELRSANCSGVAVHHLKVSAERSHVVRTDKDQTIAAARFTDLAATVRAEFGDLPPDLVLIDGPSGRVRWGRFSALLDIAHLLRPGTFVLLDDALRFREVSIMLEWRRLALVNVLGICCVGTGIGVARIA